MMKRKFHLAVGYYIPRAIGKYIIHNRKLDRYINGSRALKFLCNAIDRLIIRNDRNRIFDEDYYFKKYGNIIPPGTDLLTHFIRAGHRQGCNPCALFDVEYYRRQAGIGKDFPLNVLSHFLLHGSTRDISPTPWFDYRFYRRENRDVAQSKIDPYVHFLHFGCRENRCGSPWFDPERYLKAHPEAAASGLPALIHFLNSPEGREQDPRKPHALPYQRRHGLNSEDLIRNIPEALDRIDAPAAGVNASNPVVDVIIPVYRDREVTLRCLHSVLTSPCETPLQVVVINDCSPDTDLTEDLRKLASRNLVELIEHSRNTGFVRSVNEGMALHADRDVVLLNSDTEVYPGWLDRLRRAAYRLKNTSSVTPLTNNGTICSYPHFNQENPYPLEIGYRQLDQIAAKKNAGKTIPIPTAVGFCMYIRRDALEDVGLFDEKTFGRGYGEENDFCQRAQANGWVDVAATDVFVRHLGGISFGEEKNDRIREALEILDRRHPSYRAAVERFIALDPLRRMRMTLDLERLKLLKKKKNILIISHQRGGGTEQHVLEEAERLERNGHGVFRLFAERNHSDVVRLTHMDAPEVPNLSGIDLGSETGRRDLLSFLRALEIDRVQIHHLFEFSAKGPRIMHELLSAAGIPYDFIVHDFLALCPRINLADRNGLYCGEPDGEGCRSCLMTAGSEFGTCDITHWRKSYEILLGDADHVIAPSRDAAGRMKKYFPEANIVVLPHDGVRPAPLRDLSHRSSSGPVRIGILGAISQIKGFEVLLNCADHARRHKLPVEFVVIGYTKNNMLARRYGIRVTGPYRNEHVQEIIRKNDLDILFFPATWPETYCYTLSVALKTGLPLAAFDIGAMGERLRDLPHALLMPLELHRSPARIMERLLSFVRKFREPFLDRTLDDLLARNSVDAEKFEHDMRRIAPSSRNYIILFTPRSGSTYLTDLLSSTRCAGFPEEWFNPNWIAKVAGRLNADSVDRYIEMLKRHKKTFNGVFGAELSFFHYSMVHDCTDFFAHFPPETPFILLFRKDIVMQGISLYKAVESGVFHLTQNDDRNIETIDNILKYDSIKIKYWINHIRKQEEGLLRLVKEKGLNARILSYERMFSVENEKVLLDAFFDHAGIETLPKERRFVARHRKIGTSLNDVFRKRFTTENARFVKKLERDREPLFALMRRFPLL